MSSRSLAGVVLNSRYRIREIIGSGGMAEVYEAYDEILERDVAVKVMLPGFAADSDFPERFYREAKASASLQNAHIVSVFDWGCSDGEYYIVMELLKGRVLSRFISENAPLKIADAVTIGCQVCQALREAHGKGIIHRDIKPQNIMVLDDGMVKVMDFGIAKAGNATSPFTTVIMGTASYMSPEQAQGKTPTPASDIYSLGVVLYEMLTGTTPFSGEDSFSIVLKHISEDPAPPSSVRADLPIELDRIIMRALEKDPGNRFQTASQMALALEEVLSGEGNQASLANGVRFSSSLPMRSAQPTETMLKTLPIASHGFTNDDGEASDAPSSKSSTATTSIVLAIITISIVASFISFLLISPWDNGNASASSSNSANEEATSAFSQSQVVEGGSTGVSSSGPLPAALDGDELKEYLERFYGVVTSMDTRVRQLAEEFNENYLSSDVDVRKSSASFVDEFSKQIQARYDALVELNVPMSSEYYQSWVDLCTLYDCLARRIDAIDEAWTISLSFEDPSGHEDEITEPLSRDRGEDGNSIYLTQFEETNASFSIPE